MDPAQLRLSVSPRDWGLESSLEKTSDKFELLGLDKEDVENRCRQNTYEWLCRQFNYDLGAFHGYYDPRTKELNEPQTANLIAPWQLIAAFDRYQDGNLLDMAKHAANWIEDNISENHPMSLVMGGVRDNVKPTQLWTKYSADYVILNLTLYDRTGEEVYLIRAIQSGKFLLQAQNHDFAPKYDHWFELWMKKGWQSFGRIVVAMLALYDIAHEDPWLEWATKWAEYGLSLQDEDGCFYLINDNYYNSDIAADEIRALVKISQRTGRKEFLDSAIKFADWHLKQQRADGAWWLGIDRYGTKVSDYIGPGDVPNIAIALLMVHKVTHKIKYLASAVLALRYSMSVQAIPGNGDPYLDDPNIVWGFWSWDPYYDYTMSSDQSNHHVRGFWFFLDYFFSLSTRVQDELVKLEGQTVKAASA